MLAITCDIFFFVVVTVALKQNRHTAVKKIYFTRIEVSHFAHLIKATLFWGTLHDLQRTLSASAFNKHRVYLSQPNHNSHLALFKGAITAELERNSAVTD